MDINQAVWRVCLALSTAMAKGQVRQRDWVTVGELLLAHPPILDEVREWVTRGTMDDLSSPEMREEVRRRGTTPEDVAELGARGLLHRVLFPLTITGMLRHAQAALRDPEVAATPHPFRFGSPVPVGKADQAAHLLDSMLAQLADLP